MSLNTKMTFDQYCSAVREADVSFVLTAPEQAAWDLDFILGKSVAAQFGSDGGASIADGVVRKDAWILMCPRRFPSSRISLNGQVFREIDFPVLPPGSRFIFAADTWRTWISVSLPVHAAQKLVALPCDPIGIPGFPYPFIVPGTSELHAEYVALAETFHWASVKGAAERTIEQAERRLVQGVVRVMTEGQKHRRNAAQDGHRLESLVLVSRALQMLHAEQPCDRWHVDDLAKAADVGYHKLYRAFYRIIGMGPVRYLRCRQLNLIRRELLSCRRKGNNVTQAMQHAGASELGRIAGEYKALFCELPSDTLRRAIEKQ